ncbi:hypothetical protein [Levilactobacillus yiduensis]|uniref:hypothetical protein n=1 Tax=Levilactobacillus yiduensis TaxID=2953880 RepID=UPI001AD84869|nr:hypothetical protein [Levilactobacillus yiduensis]
MKRLKKSLMLGLAVLTAVIGLSFGGPTANAKMKFYKSVPTALRGTWQTKHWSGQASKLKFTKYTRVKGGSTTTMKAKWARRLAVKGKTKAGYYVIGLASGDMPERLKPVKHHGKKALKTYAYDPIKNKNIYFYYYRK